MGWALVAAEPHHRKGWVKRFDPRFWTVDFARPMMASVTSGAPAALRVEAVFYLFDVPVRFAEDRLEASRATFLAGEVASVPLIEVRAPHGDLA